MKCYVCKCVDNLVRNGAKRSGFSNICKGCAKRLSKERRFANRRPPKTRHVFENFLKKIIPPDSLYDCWIWGGHSTKFGYGKFNSERPIYAHRYSYEKFVKPIPCGLHIDHLCSNPRCVNPIHLEPVTQAENNKRSLQRRKDGKFTVNATRD